MGIIGAILPRKDIRRPLLLSTSLSATKRLAGGVAMDTSRFTKPGDGLPLLDLTATFAFKTSSSVSFEVGKISAVHPDDEPSFVLSGFKVIGWIDVHHPCDSCIKTQIRICIPVDYHKLERITAMVKVVCEALSISLDEHCESTVFSSGHVTGILPKVYFGMG